MRTRDILFCAAGMFILLYAVVILSDEIARHEAFARVAEPVQTRWIARSVRVDRGDFSLVSRETYTPVGTFEVVGQPGQLYDNVDLDHGTLRRERSE
jgi:hypothetical protein